MSGSAQFIGQIYVASALALGVILFALGAALVFYQRRIVAPSRDHAKRFSVRRNERAWVAREVHDDALQRVAMVAARVDDGGEMEIHTIDTAKDHSVARKSSDLGVMLRKVASPAPVDNRTAGLVPRLHALASDVRGASGFDVTSIRPPPSRSPSKESALILYRIARRRCATRRRWWH